MYKTQLALTHSFIQGTRLSNDLGTLEMSRKYLGRMVIFWNDALIENKVFTNDIVKYHIPSFNSFSSVLSFFATIGLCIFINAYDPRSFKWIVKSHNVNQLSREDRQFYTFVRGIAMRLGYWFFDNYELVDVNSQLVVEGLSSFWIPSLAIQANALYKYKITTDEDHPEFSTSWRARDLQEQLADCLELVPNAKSLFDAYLAGGRRGDLCLAWNEGINYMVRKKRSSTTTPFKRVAQQAIVCILLNMDSIPPSFGNETAGVTRVNLLGQNHQVIFDNDTQEVDTLPPDLRPINFAIKKLSMSVTEWTDIDRNDAQEAFGANQSRAAASATLDKGKVAFLATKKLLSKVVTHKDDRSASQAAAILVDLRVQDVELAAETIKALGSSAWPARPVANRILRVLENLLYDGRVGDHRDPRIERIFANENEVIVYIEGIMDTCTQMVSSKINEHLKTFLDHKIGGTISNTDFPEACHLLAFIDAKDTEDIISILSKFENCFSMPLNGVANSVSKLLAGEAPVFFQTIKENMEARVKSSAPHPFPLTAKREATPEDAHNMIAHQSKTVTVGSGPEKFKYWNIRGLRVVAAPNELKLTELPEPGDVLLYYCETSNEASAWVYYSLGWENVSGAYFAHEGTVTHPSFEEPDLRYLAWKSNTNRSPTWVKRSTMESKKRDLRPLVGITVVASETGEAPSASTSGLLCYEKWMPQLFDASKAMLQKLVRWKPSLSPNFAASVFCSTTYNFGPSVVCDFHNDHLNWSTGICAITSGGTFNYKKGGHLVLKEYKLIIEFPPCVTILVPSAMVTHGNLPIEPNEYRISVTQYTAGGLFRWVDYGFKPASDYQASRKTDPDATFREGEARWKQNINLFSKLSDLPLAP
ncbi:hypothetical protein EST38_g10208 [Candolleomyces aberdarensis]|uniref:Uncharacterized protein n=1 Tax=Candolleomyces aberdarensis TaxID=2316362 RepID=A0A4Q2D7Z7_9AGAR|nr:hypothetical protein EST38_g10208 [Candolleomyces aberdarensis]